MESMFLIYFFALIFTGLATLAGFIVLIIGLAGSKSKVRNIGLIVFGVGLIGLIASVVLSVRATVNTVQESVLTPLQNFGDSLDYYADQNSSEGNLLDDDRDYLMDDTCSNPYMKLIKEASYKNNPTILDSYFTHFGSSGFSRLPVVYPFAIHSWDGKNFGTLVNEENIPDVKYSTGEEVNIIFNVTNYNFDTKFILIKAAETQSTAQDPNSMFFLYDMTKKTNKEFKSEEELFKAAKKAGYKGENELVSLWDYDERF